MSMTDRVAQFEVWVNKKLFGRKDRIRFYRKISRQMSNGVRLQDAISSLSKISSDLSETSTFSVFYRSILPAIQDGQLLSDAIAPWVPQDDLMIIRAGEESGRISETLDQLCTSLEASAAMKSAILSAVSYPSVLIVMTVGLIMYIAGYSVPILTQATHGSVNFTGFAAGLYWLSGVVLSWKMFALIGFLFTSIIVVIASLSRWSGFGRTTFDRIPPWSFYRLMAGSSFLLSLGALMSSGMRLKDCLYELGATGSPWIRSRIGAIIFEVEEGKNIADAMFLAGHRFPDADIIEDLFVYSGLAAFDQVLIKTGIDWIQEGVNTVKAQAAVLNLIAMLVMGLGLAFVTFGMLQMADQASQMVGGH